MVKQHFALPQRYSYPPEIYERSCNFVEPLLVLKLLDSAIMGEEYFKLVFELFVEDIGASAEGVHPDDFLSGVLEFFVHDDAVGGEWFGFIKGNL